MDESLPVAVLAYHERAGEGILPVIRLMSLAAVADGAFVAAGFLVRLGFDLWQTYMPSTSRISFGAQWWIEAPIAIAGAVQMIGGILTLRTRSAGRRTILIAAVAFVICSFAYSLVQILSWNARGVGWTTSFIVVESAIILIYCLQRCIVPVAMWFFFRQPAVTDVLTASMG